MVLYGECTCQLTALVRTARTSHPALCASSRPASTMQALQGRTRHVGCWTSALCQQRRRLVLRCAAKDAPPTYLEDSVTKGLLSWASGVGISCSKLKPATFGGLRGMVATADIKTDDLLVSVPKQAAITLAPKQRNPCRDFVTDEYWGAAPWFVKLAVRLLYEQRLGASSSKQPYLASLPSRVDVPVLWRRELVQQLQYPYLVHQVHEQQQEWAALYKRLQAGLAPGAAPVDQSAFFWAMSLVRSRTFSGPYVPSTLQDRLRLAGLVAALVAINTAAGGDLGKSAGAAVAVFIFNILYEIILSQKLKQYAVCPLIDLINHSSSETAEVSYDFFRDAFSVTAANAYTPGQQVFVSYGRQSNDSLLQYYGFSEADNPDDLYVMTSLLKWAEQLHSCQQVRLDALNREQLLTSLQTVAVTRAGFPADTLQALRYLLASDAAAAAGPGAFAGPGDEEVEQKLGLLLVHACQQELACLGSSIAEDQQQLQKLKGAAKEEAASQATAVRFRIEKKKVLLACVEALCGGRAGAAAAAAAAGAAAVADGARPGTPAEVRVTA